MSACSGNSSLLRCACRWFAFWTLERGLCTCCSFAPPDVYPWACLTSPRRCEPLIVCTKMSTEPDVSSRACFSDTRNARTSHRPAPPVTQVPHFSSFSRNPLPPLANAAALSKQQILLVRFRVIIRAPPPSSFARCLSHVSGSDRRGSPACAGLGRAWKTFCRGLAGARDLCTVVEAQADLAAGRRA